MAAAAAAAAPRRSSGGSSSSSSQTNAVAFGLGLAETIAKEKRLEYRWAESVVRQQQQAAGPSSPAPPPAGDATFPPLATATTTLEAATPAQRLSRRLALSVNPGWIPAASAARTVAADAYVPPDGEVLRLALEADRAGAGALAYHKRRDNYTLYVEAAAKARLVARGGYGGYGGGGGGGGGGKGAGAKNWRAREKREETTGSKNTSA
jgi:hypothetical protein